MNNMANLKLFTHAGDTYLGMFGDDTTSGKVKVGSPVKVTFTYENAQTSTAKLTWLLTPVMPAVLIKTVDLKNEIEYNETDINVSTTLTSGKNFNEDLVKAYNSLTGENVTMSDTPAS